MRVILAMLVSLVAGNAMAECYTPLTCLYGNDLGRSMEYDRQQQQNQDTQMRQREVEQQLEDQRRQQREREIERDLDRWRIAPQSR